MLINNAQTRTYEFSNLDVNHDGFLNKKERATVNLSKNFDAAKKLKVKRQVEEAVRNTGYDNTINVGSSETISLEIELAMIRDRSGGLPPHRALSWYNISRYKHRTNGMWVYDKQNVIDAISRSIDLYDDGTIETGDLSVGNYDFGSVKIHASDREIDFSRKFFNAAGKDRLLAYGDEIKNFFQSYSQSKNGKLNSRDLDKLFQETKIYFINKTTRKQMVFVDLNIDNYIYGFANGNPVNKEGLTYNQMFRAYFG